MALADLIEQALYDWILTSTSHGFPNFFRSNRLVIKIIWFICTLISLTLCSYIIIESINGYFNYEVNSNINRFTQIPADFPMITICNKNSYLTKYGFDFYQNVSSQINTSSNKINSYDLQLFTNRFVDANTLSLNDTELKKLSYSIDDMLVNCWFNSIRCNSSQFKWIYEIEYGNCFVFNWGRESSIEQVTTASSGLKLELFIGKSDMYPTNSQTDGAVLFIGNQSYYPTQFEMISLSPGFETTISVSRSFSLKLSSPYSECISKNSYYKEIFTFYRYTQKICLTYCLEKIIENDCKCYYRLFNKSGNNIKPCITVENVKCLTQANLVFLNGNLSAFCLNKCPIECGSVDLESTVSMANFPSDDYTSILVNDYKLRAAFQNLLNISNLTRGVLRNNMLSVNIMYKNLDVILYNESPNLRLPDLVSAIGGILGLFIGISFLSFIEIIEIIVEIFYIYYEYRFKKNKVNKK